MSGGVRVCRARIYMPLALMGLALAAPARAEPSRADLARVGVNVPAGASAPLALAFRDQGGRATTLGAALGGRPGLLIFQDYRCRTLCGPTLAILAAAVKPSGLEPGRDFRLVAIGLNPRETPADAAAMQQARLGGDPALAAASRLLTGTAAAIAAATHAVGYGYAYDPASGQYTHPVAAFALAPDGRVTRFLPEIALTGADLKTALGRAGRNEVGDLVDHLRLLCHELVPLAGRYDAAVQGGLRIGGVATLMLMAAAGAALVRRRRGA